jgi:hypothetical protein
MNDVATTLHHIATRDLKASPVPHCSVQGLSNMVWGLGKLGARPPPAWLYALVKAAGKRSAERSIKLRSPAEGRCENRITAEMCTCLSRHASMLP